MPDLKLLQFVDVDRCRVASATRCEVPRAASGDDDTWVRVGISRDIMMVII
jgi:hypothetical protein